MRIAPVFLTALLAAGPVWAENRAVIIGNADYVTAPDLAGSDTAALARAARAAGFVTQEGVDLRADPLRRVLEALARADDRPGARIVALSGRFVHDSGETWFMGTDAEKPGALDAGAEGVPLSLVMRLMAGGKPGSVLILGTDAQEMPHGAGIENGIGLSTAPEGVAVITGTPELGAMALTALLRGDAVAQAVGKDPALTLLSGSDGTLVVAPQAAAVVPDAAVGDRDGWAQAAARDDAVAYRDYLTRFPQGLYVAAAQDRLHQVEGAAARQNEDRDSWADAAAKNTTAAYEAYLRDHPQGRYAQAARQRLAEMRKPAVAPTPAQTPPAARQPTAAEVAATTERGLALTQAERTQIQQRVTRLGFAAGAADGAFGTRSRQAIGNWQRANGLAPTGFLTQQQVQMIANQNQRRESDLKSRDDAYWKETGATAKAPGLRAYLERYPEGAHAKEARAQLARLTNPDAPQGEEEVWKWARREGTAAAYDTYLERFPKGIHTAEAKDQRRILRASVEAARQDEDRMHLSPGTRRLIEDRLRLAGMRPGPVDGQFNAETRAALRRYQAARNLPVTGFVTQDVVTHLLQDALLR